MNLKVLALSTVLLFSTAVFAQNNPPPANGGNGATTAQTNPQPANPNNGMAPNGTARQTAPVNSRLIRTAYDHSGAGWGWWGLLGLFGLFGLAGRGGRDRNEVVRTRNLPPQ